jgi:hypothetical protein
MPLAIRIQVTDDVANRAPDADVRRTSTVAPALAEPGLRHPEVWCGFALSDRAIFDRDCVGVLVTLCHAVEDTARIVALC